MISSQKDAQPRLGRWLKLIKFIHPPLCAGCRRRFALFCDSCLQQVKWIEPPICNACGCRLTYASDRCPQCIRRKQPLTIRAAAVFQGPLRHAIHAFKYENRFRLAQPLAGLLHSAWARWHRSVEAIIAVPLYAERQRQRGYNQSQLLAEQFGPAAGLPLLNDALFRTRHTQPQVELDHNQRWQNVKGAFAADPQRVSGGHLLLIDDVYTSGSTVRAAAQALYDAGAASVTAYCLTRAKRASRRRPAVSPNHQRKAI